MLKKVAFLGLGVMGTSMSRNLLKGGFDVSVWNRNIEKAKALETEGGKTASTPKDAANTAEAVFTCVTNGAALNEVLFGKDGLVSAETPPRVVVDHSTISPAEAKAAGAQLATKGIEFLDAPVTGGDVGARNGTLTIMVGGNEEALNFVRPALDVMGKKTFAMGPTGSGQLAKCVNQIAVAGAVAAMTEALHFASRSGLDIEQVLSILRGGAAGSWTMDNYGPRVLKHDFAPGFLAEHMLKDLRITLGEGEEFGVKLPLTELLEKLYAEVCGFIEPGTVGNHGLILRYQR